MEGQVRIEKGPEQEMGTHQLESTDGGTSQWEKKLSERQTLTLWRVQMEGQVRLGKETE
jgi:GMP synthase-like glutamine amidotransferase